MGKCLDLESCCTLKVYISWASNLFLWKFVSFPILASLIIFYLPTHIWKHTWKAYMYVWSVIMSWGVKVYSTSFQDYWTLLFSQRFCSPDNEFSPQTFVLNQNINLNVFSLLLWFFMDKNDVVKNLWRWDLH